MDKFCGPNKLHISFVEKTPHPGVPKQTWYGGWLLQTDPHSSKLHDIRIAIFLITDWILKKYVTAGLLMNDA